MHNIASMLNATIILTIIWHDICNFAHKICKLDCKKSTCSLAIGKECSVFNLLTPYCHQVLIWSKLHKQKWSNIISLYRIHFKSFGLHELCILQTQLGYNTPQKIKCTYHSNGVLYEC